MDGEPLSKTGNLFGAVDWDWDRDQDLDEPLTSECLTERKHHVSKQSQNKCEGFMGEQWSCWSRGPEELEQLRPSHAICRLKHATEPFDESSLALELGGVYINSRGEESKYLLH